MYGDNGQHHGNYDFTVGVVVRLPGVRFHFTCLVIKARLLWYERSMSRLHRPAKSLQPHVLR